MPAGLLAGHLTTARGFKCPAYRSTRLIAGVRIPQNRSPSMNAFMGAEAIIDTAPGQFQGVCKVTDMPGGNQGAC